MPNARHLPPLPAPCDARPSRRQVVAGLAASTLVLRDASPAQGAAATHRLALGPATLPLGGPGHPGAAIAAFNGQSPGPLLRVQNGTPVDIDFANDLAVPVPFDIVQGMLASPATPSPVAPGTRARYRITPTHAGTGLYHVRGRADVADLALPAGAFIVEEAAPPEVDRDHVLVIDEWRLSADGHALLPGRPIPAAARPGLFTANGHAIEEFALRAGDRVRLRLINMSPRSIVAVQIPDHAAWVIALDGQPAEPFVAREGRVVLAPHMRADLLIDATAPAGSTTPIHLHDGRTARVIARLAYATDSGRKPRDGTPAPLPANAWPTPIDLKNAIRAELVFDARTDAATAGLGWKAPADWRVEDSLLLQAASGRTIVLALTNMSPDLAVFHVHGHPFRLLDRLDDGWKPFWLESLPIDPGQTQRIAFAAGRPGPWLVEAFLADWAAPRWWRHFRVT